MNIDKLKQVIQEANPEIMELKFGCEYEHVVQDEEGNAELTLGLYGYTGTPDKDKTEKILGRPIRLADVLMVISKTKEMIMVDWKGQFREFGEDCSALRNNEYMPKWNLKDNNLDNQSEATKQFLIDILVKTAKGN